MADSRHLLAFLASISLFSMAGAQPVPQGPEFQVETSTTNRQNRPAVALAVDRSFVVVWQSEHLVGQWWDTFGQLGGEFQVNTFTTLTQGEFPEIAMHGPAGGYDQEIFARRYDDDAVPLGGAFVVNTYTTGDQSTPAVAMGRWGNFIVIWDSEGQATPDRPLSNAMFGQAFDASGAPLGGEFQ